MVKLIKYSKCNNFYQPRILLLNLRKYSLSATVVNDDQAKFNSTTRSVKSFEDIPGPSSLPLVGPLLHFLPGGTFYNMNRKELVSELHKKYGPIARLDKLLHNPTMVFLFDGESVGKILRSETMFPLRTKIESLEMYRQKFNRQNKIGNLVNSGGYEWRKHRTVVNPIMLPPKIVFESYSKVLDEIAEEALARFQTVHDEDDTIPNIDKELKFWALESTGAVTLGRRLNCLNRNLSENSYEKRLIALINSFFANLENIDFRVSPFIFPGHIEKAMKTYDELYDVIEYFLNETMERIKTKNENKLERGIVEKIWDVDKNIAMNIGLDSMVAGVDSVSHSILAFWYLLGANREKQDKLREKMVSGQDYRPYLRACMREASRIKPTVLGNVRITTKPYHILGYEIPKGVRVIFGHHEMCMSESNFPRATEYIPERWLEGKENLLSYKHASQFAHLPFGFGVRTCIGQRIAELTMEKLTTKMIQNFDITWNGPPPEMVPSTFSHMKKPYKFVFKKL